MVWDFISPAPHPKYVHPSGTTINFSHLWVNGHFWPKKVETTYVPDGCIYLPHVFGYGIKVPKVCSDDIFDQKKFSKIFEIFTPES